MGKQSQARCGLVVSEDRGVALLYRVRFRRGWLVVTALAVLTAGWASAQTIGLQGGRISRLIDQAGTARDKALGSFKDAAIASPLPDPRCPASSSIRLETDTQGLVVPLDCSFWTLQAQSFRTTNYLYTGIGTERSVSCFDPVAREGGASCR